MSKNFVKECREFIVYLKNMTAFKDVEILIWIYFNLYAYRQIESRQTSYSREAFLNFLNNDESFKIYSHKYADFTGEAYDRLRETILEKYTYENSNSKSSKVIISIKELEELYESLLHDEVRNKTGTYYTPSFVVESMVFKAVSSYIGEAAHCTDELRDYMLGKEVQISFMTAVEIIKVIESIRIIDIACGGGVFLREVLECLSHLAKEMYLILGEDYNVQILKARIVSHNLYGIDIQEETVILCKLLLAMAIDLPHDCSLSNEITFNIFCNDALLMEKGEGEPFAQKFDIVIGNPPYIGERGNKSLFDNIRQFPFGQKYYEGKMDYFYFFIYKGWEILRERGLICFITTNYFVTADGAQNLRKFMRENLSFQWIVNFNEVNIFRGAKGQHNMIFMARKEIEGKKRTTTVCFHGGKYDSRELKKILIEGTAAEGVEITRLNGQNELYDVKGLLLIQSQRAIGGIFDKICQTANYTLQDLCHVNQGIVSGADRLTASWAKKLVMEGREGSGIFVLHEREIEVISLTGESKEKYLRKFYKNSHVKRYYTLENQGLYILYINDENLNDITAYPDLYHHLLPYKEMLEQRREVKNGVRRWYALQWPRNPKIFEEEKIVAPQRALKNTFAFTKDPWYASADVYYITKKKPTISLFYLLGVLNSSLMYYWLFHRGKRKGEYFELYATPLKALPIYYPGEYRDIREMEVLVEKVLLLKGDNGEAKCVQEKIDKLVYGLYHLNSDERKEIEDFVKRRGFYK